MSDTSGSLFHVRRAAQRGSTELGWLHSRHAFSFGHYHDPAHMGFRTLRVLNDDVVEPGGGFGEHGHANMEILTWVLDGALRHRDSTGTQGVIGPGDLQVMSAGTGIVHSEMNASDEQAVHFLQVWIEPATPGLPPGYAQASFAEPRRQGRWQVLASPDAREHSLRIHQDAVVSVIDLDADQRSALPLGRDRHGYLHVAFGKVRLRDTRLETCDAAMVAAAAQGAAALELEAAQRSQLLLFDLA